MPHIIILILTLMLCLLPCSSYGKDSAEEALLRHLDDVIAHRADYSATKERKIQKLKSRLQQLEMLRKSHPAQEGKYARQQMDLLDAIYHEYYTYRYDSAMVYAKQGYELAEQYKDSYYTALNRINRAAILSTGGFYSQSEALLLEMEQQGIEPKLRQYFYYTTTWLYNYWAAFCKNSEFADSFASKKLHYLTLTIENMGNKKSPLYPYLLGERASMVESTNKTVLKNYMAAYNNSPINTRVHASSAYGIARYYQGIGNKALYEKYLVEAAISDQVCPLKENLALQELSTYLYKEDTKHAQRATKYIYCSMEDARFYNNRLRMLEISSILPVIAHANQEAANRQNRIIGITLGVVSIISIGFLCLILFSYKQNKKLTKSRREIRSQNKLLADLNQKLINTNKRRETYMRLFMDISAVYIKKLDDYRKLVSRKIKAKQTDDLLKTISSYKLAEEESNTFYTRFDKAFMELYPHFVEELNALLKPENQIVLPLPNTLTTEVRIYALMRLGVTDSQEVATLLFYSTQTIYNYKSAMRGKAKNRETFESDINKLCHIIHE